MTAVFFCFFFKKKDVVQIREFRYLLVMESMLPTLQ